MKKNETGRRIIGVICFLFLLCLTLLFANRILQYKAGTDKYKDFYKEKEPFDVLFFGSSRVLDSFQPMELWDDYKIRSYNMAQHGEGLGRDYWQLKNALEHKKTRLVVMDISAYYALYAIDPTNDEQKGGLHKQLDHMPLSLTKLKAIWELAPSKSRAEYVFPFIMYHSRWNGVSLYDFTYNRYKDSRKGAEARNDVLYLQRPVWDESICEESFPFENTKITEIVDLCNKYDTKLLFVNIPHEFEADRIGMLNWLSDYLESRGIDYINYQKDEDFLDYSIDLADEKHLNIAGSLKLTDDFGRYFVENYGVFVTDDKTKEQWDEVLADYKANKDFQVQLANTLDELFAATYADDDYEVKITASPTGLKEIGAADLFPNIKGIEGVGGYKVEVFRDGNLIKEMVSENFFYSENE